MGKTLIWAGLVLVLGGLLLLGLERLGLSPGRLPGDLGYRGKHVRIFFPLGTSLLLSVLFSLLLYPVSRFRR